MGLESQGFALPNIFVHVVCVSYARRNVYTMLRQIEWCYGQITKIRVDISVSADIFCISKTDSNSAGSQFDSDSVIPENP